MTKLQGMLSALVASIALLATGCATRPNIIVKDSVLSAEATDFIIHMTVESPGHVSSEFQMQPTTDAVLRDNLGHEYHVLGGDSSLDGSIGGGIFNTHERTGSLIFPNVDPNAMILSLSFPLYHGPNVGDALVFGFSSSQEAKWKVNAVWTKDHGRFVMLPRDAAAKIAMHR